MTRYKGQLRASRIEQEFPYHVDIVVPPGGVGTRLDAMYDFHTQHGIKPQRGHGKHNADSALRLRVSLGPNAISREDYSGSKLPTIHAHCGAI